MNYRQRAKLAVPELLVVIVVFSSLAGRLSSGLPCPVFNTSDGLQVAPVQARYEYPDNVTLSCDNSSLVLIGHHIRRCLHTGLWDTSLPVCQVIRCPKLAAPKGGTRLYEFKNSSLVAQFSCVVSHILIGQQMITCRADGTWTDVPPICSLDCSRPPSLDNAFVSSNCSFANCVALYSCEEGYSLIGSKSRMCTENGTWTDTVQVCQPKTCTWPELPPGGKFTPSMEPSGDRFLYNTTLRYHCNGNAAVDAVLWCDPMGKWQGHVPNCTKVIPPVASSDANASSVTTTGTLPMTSSMSTVNPSTTSAYTTSSTTPRLVTTPGSVPCARAPTVKQATKRRSGRLVTYRCNVGYVIDGEESIRCLSNGSWSSKPPKCVRLGGEGDEPPRGPTDKPFLWKQVFIDHKKWLGEYEFRQRRYYFHMSVHSVQLDYSGAVLGVFSEDHGSKFDVKGFKEADDIVFQIESMHHANSRIRNTDWYVRGKLEKDTCSWKYKGRISSPTAGFTTLSMESVIEDMQQDPRCSKHHHTTLVVVGVSVAIAVVVGVAAVVYYCSRRKGGFRSSGHRSLTSFENPVYEYDHSLK